MTFFKRLENTVFLLLLAPFIALAIVLQLVFWKARKL